MAAADSGRRARVLVVDDEEPVRTLVERALGAVDYDVVLASSGKGALRVVATGNQVTISFGRDQKESDRIAQGYRTFRGKSIGSVIADLLRPDRNAVLLWKQHPTPEDLDKVNGCLK